MKFKDAKTVFKFFILFLLLISIPLTVYLAQQTQKLEKRATGIGTIITVDVSQSLPLPRIWQNLAQGGEVPIPQLPVTVSQLRELAPRYIRLDHIFDAYGAVYDFSLLDKEVDAILQAGSKPFLSLSYIPSDLADPANLNRPSSYAKWQELIEATVSHYSGKNGRNIQDVFYEVYNEPDLFGKWAVDDYTSLYEASVKGGESAFDTNKYFIGGPAISYFNQNFINTFLTIAQEKNLRLDFVSWHTYDPKPWKISQDAELLAAILNDKPAFKSALKVVSEWGSYPEKNLWHDSIFDSSHLVATVSKSIGSVDMLFYFEVKDGKSLNAEKYFGGWGILTNEEFGITKKPRFYALSLLNRLKPIKYHVFGENENVYAIASGNDATDLTLILTHYSFGRSNSPLVTPIRFTNMLPGIYEVRQTVLDGKGLPYDGTPFQFLPGEGLDLNLISDNIIVLDIKRISAAATLTIGETGIADDKAAKISPSSALIYQTPPLPKSEVTKVSFSLKPSTSLSQSLDTVFFQSSASGTLIRLESKTQGFSNFLTLSVVDDKGVVSTVSTPIPASDINTWHRAEFLFDQTRALLSLSLDGTIIEGPLKSEVKLGDLVSFDGFEGAIDNISISVDGNTILSDTF